MLTLRQIEVVRAVMVSGSIAGAARLLNVAQPGISRTMKHVESVMKVRLFVRQGGRFVPSPEALDVFTQLHLVNRKIEDLNYAIRELNSGKNAELRVGSVPSIANVIVPRAIAKLKGAFPNLKINFEILKIEEAVDYLLLGKGELVFMSHHYSHPGVTFDPLYTGSLVCITAPGHPLALQESVTAEDLAPYPLIGIDPRDPYGKIMVALFEQSNLTYDMDIRARFGTTVCSLVKQNLGVAIIDCFTVADMRPDDISIIPLRNRSTFQTYVAHREDIGLSSFAEALVGHVRATMADVLDGKAGQPRLPIASEAKVPRR